MTIFPKGQLTCWRNASASFVVIPLKITITKSGSTLAAQATGQPAFNLEAVDNNTFEFEQAGVVIVFDTAGNSMTLKQGGKSFAYHKE